jgi:prevent-host-death family protein
MVQITATNFKSNFGKYLNLAGREEIRITKNGVAVAVLMPPKPQASWVDGIIGVIPGSDIDAKQVKGERLARKE